MTDYSEGGACLWFPEGTVPPTRFALSFDGFGSSIACEIRHERPGAVGVEFEVRRPHQAETLARLLRWLAG